ncbi:MAG TPA: YceI family protein, partial [Fimbriimonadaceae bacterium]|nr:YceI family protein [Fimbriimonadaceae bacterium]
MNRTLSTLALVLAASLSMAQPRTFKVVTDKLEYRNLATVESVTDFETFTGRTPKVTGTLNFDLAKKTGTGNIVVDVASIDTGIALRNDHMRGGQWLDAEKHPTIKFQTTRVAHVSGDKYRVTGQFTMRGVT